MHQYINLGEVFRRITEGAAMIRSKGEVDTADISETSRRIYNIKADINNIYNRQGTTSTVQTDLGDGIN